MDVFPKLVQLLTNLKPKINNNFKIFLMMCTRCIMKAASTLYIYIYIDRVAQSV